MCNPPPLPSSSSLLPCRGIISEQTSINAHSSPICLFSPRVTIFQNLNVGNNRQQLAGYVIEREKLERHREREREGEREREQKGKCTGASQENTLWRSRGLHCERKGNQSSASWKEEFEWIAIARALLSPPMLSNSRLDVQRG